MSYDQMMQITLECPACRRYTTVPRHREMPFAVRIVELLCPECVDETEPHVERWLGDLACEIKVNSDPALFGWPCTDCPPIGHPTDNTRCRDCPRDPDRLREDRDEHRRLFKED